MRGYLDAAAHNAQAFTPAGKAYRGALSSISGPQLAAHALTGALDRTRGHR